AVGDRLPPGAWSPRQRVDGAGRYSGPFAHWRGLMSEQGLTDYLDAACEAARRGAAVLEEWRAKFQVREKGRFDLVTDADLGSQRAIRAYLQQRFPGHGFVGEEEGAGKERPGPDAPPTWVV